MEFQVLVKAEASKSEGRAVDHVTCTDLVVDWPFDLIKAEKLACPARYEHVLTWEADLDLKRSVTIIQKEKDRTKEGGDDGPGG
ncbi:hypothetical protein L6452_09954 [Arctium lappa]|uniref:Uncharacterized protein n=1 Tax=Arctium lappa TaxID=4217 RepID=A0ACB9DLT1_ARCLA|nr:hypothetical protein L6452_09954 [Arctium lappa]